MAAKNDATVIIFDVGKTSIEREAVGSPTFYERAKKFVEAWLLKKIFTKQGDKVSLLLMGTKDTNNEMNEHYGDYQHISMSIPFEPMDWRLVNNVKNSIDPPSESVTASWLDAISVAMHYLKESNITKEKPKIILLTPFTAKVNADDVQKVIGQIGALGLDLIAITTNVVYNADPETHIVQATINNGKGVDSEVIQRIVAKTDGYLCDFDEAMSEYEYLDNKNRQRNPWNVDLKIGRHLEIKVATYILVQEVKELKPWSTRDKNGEPARSRYEYYHNDNLMTLDDMEESFCGYLIGDLVADAEKIKEKSYGGKSLVCYGFEKRSNIRDEHLAGGNIRVMVAQKGSDVAAKKFTSLTTEMRKEDLVMIARYVYNVKSTPKMVALIPNTMHKDHPKHNSLLMYELFCKDNMVKQIFPPLKPNQQSSERTKSTNEQSIAMTELIVSMELMSSGESSGKFEKLVDVSQQQVFRALVNRALAPNDPVQRKPDKDLMDLLTPTETTDSKKALRQLKVACPLEVNAAIVQESRKNPFAANLELVDQGERYSSLFSEFQDLVFDMLASKRLLETEMKDFAMKAIYTHRQLSKVKGPDAYNDWIEEFKQACVDRGEFDLWQNLVVQEKLGLITNDESGGIYATYVSNEAAAEFYKIEVSSAGAQMEVDTN